MDNRIKKVCALFLVLAVMVWEIGVSQNTVAGCREWMSSEEPAAEAVSLNHTNYSVFQEAAIPEVLGSNLSYVSVSHIYYGRTFRTRNVFGRFLCAFYLLLCLIGVYCFWVISDYLYFGRDTNLAILMAFIHDQDGQKSEKSH